MSISERAAQKLKDDLVKKFLDTGLGFRIASDGHEHFSIGLDRQGTRDRVLESGGVRFLLDASMCAILDRYDLDYADGPEGGFRLNDHRGKASPHVRQRTIIQDNSR